ncbi:MAG: type II toxin-antitoxin system VapC family toxin [Phycisphaerales bacterium]|nr:type II toxin-antitoxin system VapC family toxin [Phycisphaerales bacterium]
MTTCVIDSNVVAKWLFNEPHADIARKLFDDEEVELHAPALLLLEVGNILCKRVRWKEITRLEAQRTQAGLLGFPIEFHDFTILLDPALEISAQTGASLYDCVYVALASRLDARVVTDDQRAIRAMTAGGLSGLVVSLREFYKDA